MFHSSFHTFKMLNVSPVKLTCHIPSITANPLINNSQVSASHVGSSLKILVLRRLRQKKSLSLKPDKLHSEFQDIWAKSEALSKKKLKNKNKKVIKNESKRTTKLSGPLGLWWWI